MRTLYNAALALAVAITSVTGGLLALYTSMKVPFPFAVLLTVIILALAVLAAVGLRVLRRFRRASRRREFLPAAARPETPRDRPMISMAVVSFD
jgi:hypothetical protein